MEAKPKRNVWKYLAIIFIVLFILESAFFLWILNLGAEAMEHEEQCSQGCQNMGAASYFYYDYYDTCICYDANGVAIHEEDMS